MLCNIPLPSLPLGAKLGSSIYDDRQTKLLAAGMEITEQLLDSLQRRGVDAVVVGQRDLGRIEAFRPQGRSKQAAADRAGLRVESANDVTRELDRISAAGSASPPSLQTADTWKLKSPRSESYDRDFVNFLAEQSEYHVDRVDQISAACVRGDSSGVGELTEVMRQSLHGVAEDFDAFTCLGANPYSLPYPTRHSVHTALLASSIGIRLGYDEATVTDLGIGCLIHDIGMLTVDRMTVGARKLLDDAEFVEIAKHPFATFEAVERHVELISVRARMTAYQLHERADGSGYPRGRTLEQTHPLARVAAVADAYTALVSSRPHRPGMMPYFAMEKLIRDAGRGLYDVRAVRGLLSAVGLFPIGSYVTLSDGRVGRVIRANTADYMRPTVESWPAGNLSARATIVDLAHDPGLTIARSLASLGA